MPREYKAYLSDFINSVNKIERYNITCRFRTFCIMNWFRMVGGHFNPHPPKPPAPIHGGRGALMTTPAGQCFQTPLSLTSQLNTLARVTATWMAEYALLHCPISNRRGMPSNNNLLFITIFLSFYYVITKLRLIIQQIFRANFTANCMFYYYPLQTKYKFGFSNNQ